MRVTNSQVVRGVEMMNMIAPSISNNVIRMQVILIGKATEPVIDAYRQVRASIIEKYVKKDDDGKAVTKNNQFVWQDEKAAEATKELEDLDIASNDLSFSKINALKFFDSIDYDSLPSVVRMGEPSQMHEEIGGEKVLSLDVTYLISWMLEL